MILQIAASWTTSASMVTTRTGTVIASDSTRYVYAAYPSCKRRHGFSQTGIYESKGNRSPHRASKPGQEDHR